MSNVYDVTTMMMIIIIMGGDCNKILLFESSRVRKTRIRKKRIVPKDRIKIYARTNTREYCYLVYPRYIGKMVRKTFPLEIWATSICFVPESLTMHHRITELFFPFPPLLFSSLSLLSYFILFFFFLFLSIQFYFVHFSLNVYSNIFQTDRWHGWLHYRMFF